MAAGPFIFGGGSDTPIGDTGGDSGWLSGIGDLFSTIGTAVAGTYRAVNTPIQRQALPATTFRWGTGGPLGTGGGISSGVIVLGALAIAAVLLLRKR